MSVRIFSKTQDPVRQEFVTQAVFAGRRMADAINAKKGTDIELQPMPAWRTVLMDRDDAFFSLAQRRTGLAAKILGPWNTVAHVVVHSESRKDGHVVTTTAYPAWRSGRASYTTPVAEPNALPDNASDMMSKIVIMAAAGGVFSLPKPKKNVREGARAGL